MITIVWLDDRPQEVLDLYTQFLEDNGCSIAICEDYDAFFDRWKPENVDIVISDWMVDGECAIDFAQKLRTYEGYVNLPLMVITKDDNQNNITRGLVSGIDDYLLKPVNNHILVGKIKYQLRDGHFFSNSLLMRKQYVFANRYQIQGTIGAGGSSTVYHAIDLRSKKNVALKLMNIPGGKDDSSSHMFLREIYNHSRLSHGGIVKLIDFGYHDYLCFMALEYLEGKTLKEVLQEDVFSLELASQVTLAVVEVLAYFDSQDLVHRDIKPSNIILTASNQVKIIDFGLCKGQYDYTVSSKENINGTPQFVSPEQILGNVNLDIKSDIYSLGATLYYLFTGVFPFRGDSLVATLSKHLTGSAERLGKFREDLPPDICLLVHSMMSKEKKKRPKIREIRDGFLKYSNATKEKA